MEYENLDLEEYVHHVETVIIPRHAKHKKSRKQMNWTLVIVSPLLVASIVLMVLRGDEGWALIEMTIGSLLALFSYLESYTWNKICILTDIMVKDKDAVKAILEKNHGA